MQQPTCSNIRIRSTRDAHIIFHAVSLNILPIISRRLDADERAALRSGCVYAWEERGPHTEVTGLGIERFTEGRRWGPSRVRDEFLFYYEKSPPGHLRDKENPYLEERMRKHWDPLVKQTYSVWVDSPRGRRKWHLTAYFTQATVDRLQTVDDLPQLAGIEVPPGEYISTRLGKPRRQDDSIVAGSAGHTADPSSHDVFRPTNATTLRTYAPFPMPYQVTPPVPSVGPPQNVYDHHQQYYGHPPPPMNGYDYPQQQLLGRPIHPVPEPNRQYYNGAPTVRHPAEYSQAAPHGYYTRPDYNGFHSYQNYNAPPQYTYIPPANSHANSQLPTPTSASTRSSPAYSQHEYSEHAAYSASPPLPYESPAAGGSMSLTSQPYQTLLPSTYDGIKRPPPISIPSPTRAGLPSPESTVPGGTSASPRRPTLTLPPHLANRLSPPVSDARDEHLQNGSPALSPPHSPLSATSSSSVPGGKQLNLAPLRTLVRAQAHPYRRDKFDDKALMAFTGRKGSD